MKKQLIPMKRMKLPTQPLKSMFKQQEEFQKRFYNFKTMSPDQIVEYQRLMLTCISVEAMEAMDWTNWKPWRKTKEEFNRYEYLNELVDVMHFMINSAISVGCTDKEFARLFFNKGRENVRRQQKGY